MSSSLEPIRILVVDDEKAICDVLSASLKDEGFEVEQASDGEEGLAKIRLFDPNVVLLDIWMPGHLDGLEVLRQARSDSRDTQFIIMSGHGTIETAVKAVRLGAWDFVEKPLSMDKISIMIQNALAYQFELKEKRVLLDRLRKNIAIVGSSEQMKTLKQMISRFAHGDAWTLISGENGSGKRLTAQNIHYLSQRASGPFVEFNCSSVPQETAEIELFGCERGVLPGVDHLRHGKFDLAAAGTLFVQEIGDLSLAMQESLMRVLQDRRFKRVGSSQFVESNARLIASTSYDLAEMVSDGRFREDLYCRFQVSLLHLAPLRERPQDLPDLIDYFSSGFSRESAVKKKSFSSESIETLCSYLWPGNIRELRNFVERLYILTPGSEIQLHDLQYAGLPGLDKNGTLGLNFREARSQFEKEFLIQKIQLNKGNISKTAESIGLERSYLHRKIKAYGLDVGGGDKSI